jgi:hypothetical protein
MAAPAKVSAGRPQPCPKQSIDTIMAGLIQSSLEGLADRFDRLESKLEAMQKNIADKFDRLESKIGAMQKNNSTKKNNAKSANNGAKKTNNLTTTSINSTVQAAPIAETTV